jgi:predicted CXXCH cytochrome family protein
MKQTLPAKPTEPGSLARHRLPWLLAALLLCPAVTSAGIASTKHNLTGTDGGPVMDVCIFCHTPAGDPNAAAEPSWNINGDDGSTTFTTFDDLGRLDPNSDGASGTVSVACLSCHDDAQAFGVNYSKQDHPFGVVYRGASIPGIDIDNLPRTSTDSTGTVTYEQGSESAPALFATSAEIVTAGFRPTTYGIIDDNPTWWVDTGLEGRQRTDIKLYSRHYGENTAVPFIECASCHDPHSETSTFLRVDNAGSGLCLSCHDI